MEPPGLRKKGIITERINFLISSSFALSSKNERPVPPGPEVEINPWKKVKVSLRDTSVGTHIDGDDLIVLNF
jgi:hypothetical protein